METLLESRGHIKASIERVYNFSQSIPEDTISEVIEVRLDRLEDSWKDFTGNQYDLHTYHSTERYVDPEPEFEAVEYQFIAAKTRLLTFLRSNFPRDSFGCRNHGQLSLPGVSRALDFSAERTNPPEAPDGVVRNHALSTGSAKKQSKAFENSSYDKNIPGTKLSSKIELPAFKITPFAGDYHEWPCFRDLFLGSIDRRKNLTGSQKFRYLKSFLRDEAASLLNDIDISDANYLPAWEKLERRYNKPLYIINQLIVTFLNMPSVNSADSNLLRKLVDNADEVIRGLAVLESFNRDPWLIYLLINKTDSDTRKAWALKIKYSEDATIHELIEFLKARYSALEASDTKFKFNKTNSRTQSTSAKIKSLAVAKLTCPKCKNDHQVNQCSEFIAMSVVDRRRFARDQRLCYNCLGTQHSSSRCRTMSRCVYCRARHHTLVHLDPAALGNTINESDSRNGSSCPSPPSPSVLSHIIKAGNQTSGILPTVLVKIMDAAGSPRLCRALLDTGSQVSFVTDQVVKSLGLSRRHARLSISGISAVDAGVTQGVVTLRLNSRFDSPIMNVEAFVLKNITSKTPPHSFEFENPLPLNDLQLADPGFNTPAAVDILLGSDKVWSSLRDGHRSDSKGNIFAHNTVFGWVIAGGLPENQIVSMQIGVDIDVLLKSFWELEKTGSRLPSAESEDFADKHFERTFSRAPDNKFIVQLPFRQEDVRFANTLSGAISRLFSLERRLSRDINLRSKYREFMKVYEELGHMERIPNAEIEPTTGRIFYLPHHAVLTTKLTIAFNGSYKDSNGHSLNEFLHTGPPLQGNLLNVYMQFRLYRYVFCADIVKMFRQIWVSPKDRNFQRIVWRESPDDPIVHYRLNTVTYGTTPAPFLAIKVLHQLAKEYQHQFPKASYAILHNSYVDDFAAGEDSLLGVLELRKQLIGLLSCGGLELSKWVSNCWGIHSTTDEDQKFSLEPETEWKKVLGIVWNPYQDIFTFKLALKDTSVPTKRLLLSDVSKIFDPMGFLAPSTILFKMLFQELWLDKNKIDWDDPLPKLIADKWSLYRRELIIFEQLRIARRYTLNAKEFDLIGFCNASENAYSAVVYARSVSEGGEVAVHLVAAKTRVAPVKQISIPRLELCGALILSRLLKLLCSSLDVTPGHILAFTDSTIVLTWLSSLPVKWNTFVANRTAEILDNFSRSAWNHVRSEENPADSASRGVEPSKLLDLQLWWKGPNWITKSFSQWPASTTMELSIVPEERKSKTPALTSQIYKSWFEELLCKIPSWPRLIRIVAYILRFAKNCKLPRNKRWFEFLSTSELLASKLVCIRLGQEDFKEDNLRLKKSKQISQHSKLSSLSPFLDEVGLLRVGGRITNVPNASFSMEHPIILPKNHISKLILSDAHKRFLHAGVSELFSVIRQEFWIIGARNMIRKIVHDCFPCFRLRSSTSSQITGNLPSTRLSASFAFAKTGCDYAGPIMLRASKLRNAKQIKGYFALFVCMATKAIHLEVVNDLSTDAFIAALRRFVARRGKCEVIHSDNGTNFKGAARKLSEVYALIRSRKHNEIVSLALAAENITWKFIPPHAPHFGGLWEAGVKCVKQHLCRVIGNNVLTYEEMTTLLSQIEALINSRPLCAISDTDLNPLTPSHFLIGRPYTAIPETSGLEVPPVNRLRRWELVQNMLQGFWKRWNLDYITSLQQRPKWRQESRDFKVGDLVVVKDSNLPPSQWALGRIEELHSDKDGHIRVVTLRTQSGRYKRAITKLALLPIS